MSDLEQFEETVLLAGRKVRTPEGSDFYGLPIGAYITEDLVNLKRQQAAAKGLQAPKGALSSAENAKAKAPSMKKTSSLKGPAKFKVGDTEFSAPSGSKVIRPKKTPGIAYVRTPNGEIHVFNGSGEVDTPPVMLSLLKKKFSADYAPDDLYDVEDVSSDVDAPAPVDPKDALEGTIAVSGDGEPLFVKNEAGEWEHAELGLVVADEDLKEMVDSGDVVLSPPPASDEPDAPAVEEPSVEADADETDISSMDFTEAHIAIVAAPAGSQIQVKSDDKPVFTKGENGVWTTEDGKEYSSVVMASLRSAMGPITSKKTDSKPVDKKEDDDSKTEAPAPEAKPEATTPAPEGDSTPAPDAAPAPVEEAVKKTPTTKSSDSTPSKAAAPAASDAPAPKKAENKSPEPAAKPADEPAPKKAESKSPEPAAKPFATKPANGTPKGVPDDALQFDVEDVDQVPMGETIYLKSPDSASPLKMVKETKSHYSWDPEDGGAPIMFGKSNLVATAPGTLFFMGGTPKDKTPVSVPEPPAVPTPAVEEKKGYAAGDKIAKFGHLRDMPVGSKVRVAGNGYSPSKGYVLEKSEEGWLDNGEVVPPGAIADEIVTGDLYFESAPAPAADVSLLKGGDSYTKEQIAEAVNALEAHSGFQIAYGFKSIPDHPLAAKEVQDAVKTEAMKAYPDLKPKQAFLAYLKDKGGISSAPEADAPKVPAAVATATIKIGSDTPEMKSIQGLNGGTFTAAEVADAISILENHKGKLFKAELNKKGNPLGKLDPNEIVGFNKDKTVTKQKFLDLLKTNLASAQAAPSTPDTAPEADEFETIDTFDGLYDLPYGAEITNNGKTFVKDKFFWVEKETNLPGPGTASLLSEYGPSFKVKKKDLEPNEKSMENAPLGSVVESGGQTFKKSGSGDWVTEDPDFPITISEEVLTQAPKKKWVSRTKAGDLPKEEAAAALTPAEADKIPEPEAKTAAGAAIGSKIKVSGGDEYWEKTSEGTWKFSGNGAEVETSLMQTWLEEDDGVLSWKSDDGKTTFDAKEGDQIEFDGEIWTKTDESLWGNQTDTYEIMNASMQGQITNGNAVWKKFNGVNENEDDNDSTTEPDVDAPNADPDAIKPGKYSATKTAKAYMLVKEDGTGLYVNSKGDITDLDADKVKKNFDAGMKTHAPLPAKMPAAGPAPKKAVSAKDVADLPDGVYFAGDPAAFGTTVYEVKDGKVFKKVPKKTLEEYGTKQALGKAPTPQWAADAPEGAKIKLNTSTTSDTIYTKSSDGLWYGPDGESEKVSEDLKVYWKASNYLIASHGPDDVTEVKPATLKNMFLKGKVLDAENSSIVPEGYSGTLTLLGAETNPVALSQVKEFLDTINLDDYSNINQVFNAIKTQGLYVDLPTTRKAMLKQFNAEVPSQISKEQVKEFFLGRIQPYLDGVEVEVPESDAAALFEYDALGQPKFPEALTQYAGNLYNVSDMNAFIKEAAAQFGDGKIIGQFYSKMSKYDKSDWISAFKIGDFKAMYALEVAAGAKANKVHPNGFKHPGFSGNAETNKISWGPAVDGEISALVDVPGDWTSNGYYGTPPSIEEVNNYLIKAQMQHPEYLTLSERRNWVKYHRNNDKTYVDQLSVLAKQRKESGSATLSDPLVWTDDVKPAKSYDSLFEETPFPQAWAATPAQEYWDDHIEKMPEMQPYLDAVMKEQPYSNLTYQKQSAVVNYFAHKKAEADALALIPVYSKKPNQTVKKSTHPVFQYTDQFGKEYFFKPRADTKLDRYRSEVEHLGNEFGRTFGFSTAESKLVTLDGQYGQLQGDVGGVADLMGFDYSTLTAQQIGDIGSEHVLDWFLDNDDTKGDNAKILPSGRIVGIDKGRAFKHFGKWKGLSGDYQMDSNAATIYNALYSTIREGKIDKATVDAAYRAVSSKARKMAKVSDAKITEMLAEGMKNRPSYDVDYTIDGKKVPQNLAGLTAAVLDRKNRLPEQIDQMWAKIYKDAGFGDLPEQPSNPLGDVFSGLDDARWHESVLKLKATGTSTMVANKAVIGGNVLGWTEKDIDGSTTAKGKFFTAPKAQQTLLNYFSANAVGVKGEKAQVIGFGQYDTYGDSLIGAAKTINHHAGDGAYNPEKIAAFEAAKVKIQQDLDEWSPTLVANAKIGGAEAYKFQSGSVVPMHHVDQYKLMLDHYAPHIANIENAKGSQGKVTPHIEKFSPIPISSKSKWAKEDSDTSYTVLANGKALHTTTGSSSPEIVDYDDDLVAELKKQGYIDIFADAEPEAGSGVVISKNSYTHEREAEYDPETHEKKILPKDSFSVSGTSGSEYEAVLPTGEKIYFRNAGQTGTAKGQQGQVTFEMPNTETPEAMQASMDRINAFLDSIGMDMSPADETSAELVYWREMYGILENRNHEGPEQATLKKTYARMNEKVKEMGGNPHHFLEDLAEKMTPEQEIEYWRGLWSEHFGDKVQDLIASEGFLPKFDHQDWRQPDLATGLPYWERFDVDLSEVYAQDFALVHSTGQSDLTNVLTSGALLSGEERIRQIGKIYTGGGFGSGSPLTDQTNGSSHQIYTRIMGTHNASDYDVIIDPRVLLRTRLYSLGSDNYGNLASRKDGSPSHPVGAIKKFKGGGSNETMAPNSVTLFDTVEVVSVSTAAQRDKMIQELKKAGLETIRGLPVEDRIVVKANMKAAIEKIKKNWAAKAVKK